jgi:hypothetical protein
MLVFIDESGDPGLDMHKSGTSQYFVVSLVVFEDEEEATACDQRIELLKYELGWRPRSEFHFHRNSHRVRTTFLEAVSRYNFFYYGIVIQKNKLWGEGFKDRKSFYKYITSLVFENAKDKLDNATIVIDRSGDTEFRQELAKYLRRKMNDERYVIHKVKQQDSERNNLLQLADYTAGIINRSKTRATSEKKQIDFRRITSHREIYVQIWPK